MAKNSRTIAVSLGVPEHVLQRIGPDIGLVLVSLGGDPVAAEYPAPVVVLFGSEGAGDIQRLWDPPFAAWIEIIDRLPDQAGPAIRRLAPDTLLAAMTTLATEQVSLAHGLAQTIGRRCGLDAERTADIELALHEALSNAVLHGNLGIRSFHDLSVAALERFGDEYCASLEDPHRSRRFIEVLCRLTPDDICIEVTDEGEGFKPAGPPEAQASGRGLTFISTVARSVDILDGGRRIRMRFDR